MTSVVLVVDMVVGFMEEGHNLYCGDHARRIIPLVRELLERERREGSSVFFICDTHDPDDLEFEMFPIHCVRGTEEAELISELREFEGTTIRKRRYSAFFDTDLEQRLAELRPDRIVICGVCTDICVMHTASDARNRDYRVEIPMDCVASFDADAHRYALEHMEKILGAKMTSSSAASYSL